MTDADDTILVNRRTLASALLCAFRYSLGRMTYITGDCAEWLEDYWHIMPEEWRKQIHRDIREAIDNGLAGHQCDVDAWQRVLALPISREEGNAP